MESFKLRDIISDIRVFLYGGIATLPLTIAGTLSILGLFTANYAILFFLLGFLILTPLSASIINFGLSAIFDGKSLQLESPLNLDVGTMVRIIVDTILQQEKTQKTFFETAQSLQLQGNPDWSEKID